MKSILLLACLLGFACAAEWQVISPNVMTVAFGVSASTADTIYVSGGTDGGGGAILKSSDAGATWAELPRDSQLMYISVDAAHGSNDVVAGSLGFYGQVAVGSYTNDGEVFQALPFTPLFSACQSATAANDAFYLVGFWASIRGASDGVISSKDGGLSVEFHEWSGGTGARYGDFPSNSSWYISGGTWGDSKRRSLSDPEQPFDYSHRIRINRFNGKMSFEFMDIKNYDRNGYTALLQKSTDGGATFETVYNDTGRFYFNGIDCIDDLNCWVTAEGPEGAWILRSADGGRTWSEQTFRPDDSLLDVQMLNENEGWAVGGVILSNTFNALFLHTVDGGKTWEVGNTIANAYPNALSLVTKDSAYATAFMRNGLSSILAYK